MSFNNVPMMVLERMSPDEVAEMVADLRMEADRMDDWNKRRGLWTEPSPRWQVTTPPTSPGDYGKIQVKGNWR